MESDYSKIVNVNDIDVSLQLEPYFKSELMTKYRLSQPKTFVVDLETKEMIEEKEEPVGSKVTRLFGVFPIAETVKYQKNKTILKNYYTAETPEMLAIKKQIAITLSDKKVVFTNRVMGDPTKVTKVTGVTIRPNVIKCHDTYYINYHIVKNQVKDSIHMD